MSVTVNVLILTLFVALKMQNMHYMKRSLLVMAILALTLLAEGQSAFQNRPPLRERLILRGWLRPHIREHNQY